MFTSPGTDLYALSQGFSTAIVVPVVLSLLIVGFVGVAAFWRRS